MLNNIDLRTLLHRGALVQTTGNLQSLHLLTAALGEEPWVVAVLSQVICEIVSAYEGSHVVKRTESI